MTVRHIPRNLLDRDAAGARCGSRHPASCDATGQQAVFFSDEDDEACRALAAEYCAPVGDDDLRFPAHPPGPRLERRPSAPSSAVLRVLGGRIIEPQRAQRRAEGSLRVFGLARLPSPPAAAG